MKITLIGAGSQTFGPATVRDVLLSEPLADSGVELMLMDAVADHLAPVEAYTRRLVETMGHGAKVSATTDLDSAVEDARFVVSAIEVDRWRYWSQDFHVPRKYGFRQVYGENGGPGGMFHALRNFGPTLTIADTIARLAPDALLLNFANPEHKLCEAISRLTDVSAVGLCHGVFMGIEQISQMLQMDEGDLDLAACGINHLSWFQRIRDRRTGEDLYPRLREIERQGDWVSDWHEIALSRILLRRFGLWPSPAANHIGEYVRWADEFVASELQYFYDPGDGNPWENGAPPPEFLYTIDRADIQRPWGGQAPALPVLEDAPLEHSGELTVAIIEALACGVHHHLPAINVPNAGAIPGLPDDMVVEVPADADASGLHPQRMEPLPEAIAAIIRLHGSIHKLLVEAYAEESKDKLLQAILLDPTVDSYRRAVEMMDEMLVLQRDLLPALH
jgi:alpha-galactosidase